MYLLRQHLWNYGLQWAKMYGLPHGYIYHIYGHLGAKLFIVSGITSRIKISCLSSIFNHSKNKQLKKTVLQNEYAANPHHHNIGVFCYTSNHNLKHE